MASIRLIKNLKKKFLNLKKINALPIVEEFRSAQFEANELLQLMVSTMEQSLNKHNEKAHHDS